jgi:hypothetical protein
MKPEELKKRTKAVLPCDASSRPSVATLARGSCDAGQLACQRDFGGLPITVPRAGAVASRIHCEESAWSRRSRRIGILVGTDLGGRIHVKKTRRRTFTRKPANSRRFLLASHITATKRARKVGSRAANQQSAISKHKDEPRHIAIIMDGNGRWAQERGLPRLKGHERGAESDARGDGGNRGTRLGVPHAYAFSTVELETPGRRGHQAVDAARRIFIAQELPTMMKNGVRLRTIGRTDELPESTRAKLAETIAATGEQIPPPRSSSRSTTVPAPNSPYAARSLAADAAAGGSSPRTSRRS